MNKNDRLFENFHYILHQNNDAEQRNIPDFLLLKSLKVVGPRFQDKELFAQQDFNFLLEAILYAQEHNIPINPDFSGTFDTLEKNSYFKPSDFLKSNDKADIISINHIVQPHVQLPENDKKKKTYDSYQNAGGVSEKHHIKGVWEQAASQHQVKLIFVFGGNGEVSNEQFLGSNFSLLCIKNMKNTSMQVLIDNRYYDKIKSFISLPQPVKSAAELKNSNA